MKNKKYIWSILFILSILILVFSSKDIKHYYYVKMGNKNYYSKNYEKAISYYEKALKIKEDYNVRINLIITDYQMKNYKKVIESPVENGFLKGNSLVLMSEKAQNNIEDLNKALEYYKKEILINDDINIKKNYEIIQNRLKEQQSQDKSQENKDKEQNQKSSKNNEKSQDNKENSNNENNKDNQGQDNEKQNQNNKEDSNNNQPNQNNNDKQNNFQKNLNNTDKEKSKNNAQEKNQNSSYEKENNKNSNSQKELQLILKNLEKNEKQSFKNNERLIGVENESDTKNRW